MEDPVTKFPETFDGRFYFTNASNEDFTTKWNNVEYTFPAQMMTPIVIPEESANNIQSIRKKFARDYAEWRFYKSDRLKQLESQTPVGQGEHLQTALTYTPSDLQPYVDECLMPLPISAPVQPKAVASRAVSVSPSTKVLKASATEEGAVIDAESLVGQGTVVA